MREEEKSKMSREEYKQCKREREKQIENVRKNQQYVENYIMDGIFKIIKDISNKKKIQKYEKKKAELIESLKSEDEEKLGKMVNSYNGEMKTIIRQELKRRGVLSKYTSYSLLDERENEN